VAARSGQGWKGLAFHVTPKLPMSAVTTRVLAAVLLTTTVIVPSSAAPAKRWFLTLNAWSHTNASLTPRDKTTIHWEESFKTRDECHAKTTHNPKEPRLDRRASRGSGCRQNHRSLSKRPRPSFLGQLARVAQYSLARLRLRQVARQRDDLGIVTSRSNAGGAQVGQWRLPG